MDYSQNTSEMQQNPNPNSELSYLHTNNYPYSLNSNPYQPTTIDPHGALYLNQPRPPGVDAAYVPPPVAVQYTQHPVSYEPQQVVTATATAYYQDPNVASYYQDPNASWPAAAITQLGATPYAAGVTTTNPAIQPQRRNTKKKGPKKTTIVQSAWCEVCKICCNSKDVLDQHKLGKKHMKNLEKLKAKFTAVPPPTVLATPPATVIVPAPLPVFTSGPIDKPTIGPEENPEKPKLTNSQKARRKAASARIEDLETKRRRVLEGGATAATVRACHVCNVVCNSDTVFNFHLAGQKHASMIKKHTSNAAVAPTI